MTKFYTQDIAIEIVKTLLTSDQRELIEADAEEATSARIIALRAFDIAEALIEVYNERYT
ncbi:MAG: hypothetical protein DDT31_00619 [Syntrophomonadaceae bacterium]|nr:hypothetical protein [Bacillota bacterium]